MSQLPTLLPRPPKPTTPPPRPITPPPGPYGHCLGLDNPFWVEQPLPPTVPILTRREKRQGRPRLTRDDRCRIFTLRYDAKWTNKEIARFFKLDESSVRYIIKQGRPTPQHQKSGRPPKLMNHEAQRIIDFVCQNRTTRRMPATQIHQELFPDPDCGIGVDAVRNCLHRAGFTRRAALRKPFINEINRRKRFIFALEHVH